MTNKSPQSPESYFFTQIGVIVKWQMATGWENGQSCIASKSEDRYNFMEVKQAINVRNLKNCKAFDPVIPVPGIYPEE